MSWSPLRRLIVPVALLLLSLWLRPRAADLKPVYQPLLDFLPYVTLGLAAVLCTYFNHSRRFAAALAMAATYTVILTRLQSALTDPASLTVFGLVSIALPVVIILLVLLPESGLKNRFGMMTVSVVPVVFLAGWWVSVQTATLPPLIQTWMPIRPFPMSVLPLGGWIAFFAGFVLTLAVLLREETEPAAGLFSVLLFTFVTLVLFDHEKISAVMFSTAGLALMASEVRSSYDMAFRDELTGLLGRRALNDRLKGLGSRYVIAMLDVDHFKQFNDTYGHDVGDDVLKMVAKQIDRVGGGGTAYRYGGEEFSIVFPGREVEDCEPHLEAVRKSVARYRLTLRDKKARAVPKKVAEQRRGRRRNARGPGFVSVTISIGAAEPNERRRTPEDVIKAADAALYKAKEKGRNCLVY